MTPHFQAVELACKCGCGMLPEQDFMNKVEGLRVAYGRPLFVTSAARCPEYNRQVSETGLDGPHTTGRAIDFGVERAEAWRLLDLAFQLGFTGIGVQQKRFKRFIHLDDLPATPDRVRPTVWSY
ncbi:MAG: peptidase M15 [Siphoviridae sp. ctdEk19]|nr:MAG: peptidase M15 [Siphoviridae sp. ctdEk19]